MKFTVEMLAFGRPGEVREVYCPSINSYPPEHIFVAARFPNVAELMCQEVFRYGQNEHQPQPHPSVSAGDVINIGEDKWLVLAVGFKKLTPDQYTLYKETPQSERIMIPFTLKP